MKNYVNGIKSALSFWKKIWSREIAAGLTFYFVTGFAPVLCVLLFFCGKIFPSDFFENSYFFSAVSGFTGAFNSAAARIVKRSGVLFAFTSVYSSVNLFYRFKRCGIMLYGYEPEGKTLISRAVSLLYVGITVVFFVVLGFVFFIANSVFKGVLLKAVLFITTAAASFFLLVLMNLLVCPYRLSLREVYKGSALTLVLIVLLTYIFGIYLNGFASFDKLYGAFSGFFSFVIYSYFLMQAFTFGVAFNIMRLGRLRRLKKTHGATSARGEKS